MSTTPPINFSAVSMTLAIRQSCLYKLSYTWKWKIRKNSIFRCKVHSTKLFTKNEKKYTWKFFSFIMGVVDTADKYSFAIISVNFRKKSKWSQWHTQGPGGHWFTKKTGSRKSRFRLLKGIDRSFELRGERRLIWSIMTNWMLGNFFYFILKGHHHKISKKPLDAD